MKAFRKSWLRCINCQYQCTLSHVTSGCALLVAVCIFMLPMLEVATGHVQLTSRGHKNRTDPHHMIKHTPLLLPSLYYVLPAMVLQNDVVRSNMWCLSCSSFYSYVHHDTSSLCLSVPSGLWRKVVEIVVVLLLLMSGDIERNPGPVENGLTADDLGCVMEEVLDISAEWYDLGLQLKVRTGTLDRIRADFTAVKHQLREMLKVWLTTGDIPNWRTLIAALRSQMVGASQLAALLERKYCPLQETEVERVTSASDGTNVISPSLTSQPLLSQQTNMQQRTQVHLDPNPRPPTVASPSHSLTPAHTGMPHTGTIPKYSNPSARLFYNPGTTKAENGAETHCCAESDENTHLSRHSSSTSPPAIQKPPFGCGCGKCTFFNFIERGCPKPISTASSFPYLDLSGLTDEQQQELRGRLCFESQEIIVHFQELVSTTMLSLKNQHIPITDLVSNIMTMGAFDPVYKGPQMPAFYHYFQELKTADTVSKVFLVLADYFSFFNYHILEHIIKVHGTKEDKDNLLRYKNEFDQYAKRRVFECHPQFGSESEMDHANVFVKMDFQYENYTVIEVERFRYQLSKIIHISSDGVLRLCRVEKGCFKLTFQVPSFVHQKLFPLSKKQERALAEKKVIRLTCGNYQFLAKEYEQSRPGSGCPPAFNFLSPWGYCLKEEKDREKALSLPWPTLEGEVETTRLLKYNALRGKRPSSKHTLIWDKLVGMVKAKEKAVMPSGDAALIHILYNPKNVQVLVELLQKPGINPNIRNENFDAPLHALVKSSRRDKIELLISFLTYSSANVNLQAADEMTALHFAVQSGDVMCAKTLISFGADVNPLNVHHQTPLDLATIAWASQERNRKVSKASYQYSILEECALLEASYQSGTSAEDPREFMQSIQIRMSLSDSVDANEEVKQKGTASAGSEMVQQMHEMLDLLYAVGALSSKSRKLRFNTIPKLVESGDFSSESGLERSIKLKDYDEGKTVLSLYEKLEDYINRRIESQESLSLNMDEAIAMTYQQQEMHRYKKTCKDEQHGIGFEVRGGSRVLFLDGGGIKGLVQIEVLSQLEQETGRKITELFDWIVGSSTGGILALGMVYAGKSLLEIRQWYFKMKEEVFSSPRAGLPFNTRALEKLLQDELGTEMCMSDVKQPKVLVAAVNKKHVPLKLHFFNNCFNDEFSHQPVWKVARYTSAAPVFFKEFENYVDGGVLANNPCDYGLTAIQNYYRQQGIDLPIALVVSVGTGIYPSEELGRIDAQEFLFFGKHWFNVTDTLKKRTSNLIQLLSNALVESEMVANNCSSRCAEQGIPFYRFSPQLKEVIVVGETDNEKLLDMIIQTKCQTPAQRMMELVKLFQLVAEASRKMKFLDNRKRAASVPASTNL